LYQYISAKDSDRKFTLDEARVKLEQEIDSKKTDLTNSKNEKINQRISEIENELLKINSSIAEYENIIGKNEVDKALSQLQLSTARAEGAKEAYTENIKISQNEIDRATKEKSNLTERRKTLEAEKTDLLRALN
jgi:predicted  nucleic acid-binding Zn-ribbon protein